MKWMREIIKPTKLKERFVMRFKQLLVTALIAAGSLTASLATPPYVGAIVIDSQYYRPTHYVEYNPYLVLTNATSPYLWSASNILVQVDAGSTVTSAYWWASEMWTSTPYYHCVYKNSFNDMYNNPHWVPDHYGPVQGEPLYIGTMSSGTQMLGLEVLGNGTQNFHFPGLAFYTNCYYVYDGSDLTTAIFYEDGTVYIYP